MARVQTKPRGNRGNPPNDPLAAVGILEPPDSDDTPQESDPAQLDIQPAARPRPTGKALTFFDHMARIPKADWGTRASIRLYRLEPMIDRLRGSNNKYITMYEEPITEEKIKVEHGSGRYRLYLNYKQAAAKEGKELDMVEIDIMDQQYPPKIPPGEWVDDPRNKKWAWAKQPEPVAQPQQQQGSVLETMKVLNEIRRDAREEMRPEPAPAQPSVLDMIKGVKELLPAPAPATDNGLLNTVVTLLTTQITAQQAETAALRAELRQRDSNNGNSGFSVEKIVEGANQLMPLVEKIWPAAKAGADAVVQRAVRSNMSGWQEFLQPMLPEIIKSPIWGAIAHGMMTKSANGTPSPQPPPGIAPPQLNPAPGPQAAQPPATDPYASLVGFLNELWPPMRNHLSLDGPGEEIGDSFAAWVYDGYSADPRYDQAVSAARMAGVPQVVALYKGSPYWATLAPIEGKFTAFLDAMLKWNPPPDDEPEDGVIDLSEVPA